MNLEDKQVNILKSLAHPIRVKIVRKLIDNSLCVCELNQDISFSQSNLSQHLKILKDADILIQEKDGNKTYFRIKNKEVIDLLDIVEKLAFKELSRIQYQIGGKII